MRLYSRPTFDGEFGTALRVRQAFGARIVVPTTRYRGLGRAYSRDRYVMPHEWGWRKRRDPARDTVTILPIWLALALDLWDARWAPFRLAMRLGLWDVREGSRYTEGHATWPLWLRRAAWCFLHDTDAVGYGGPGRPRFSDRPIAGAPFYGLTPREYEDARRAAFLRVAEQQVGWQARAERIVVGFDPARPGADRTVRWSVPRG